jgi:hypothetical protein
VYYYHEVSRKSRWDPPLLGAKRPAQEPAVHMQSPASESSAARSSFKSFSGVEPHLPHSDRNSTGAPQARSLSALVDGNGHRRPTTTRTDQEQGVFNTRTQKTDGTVGRHDSLNGAAYFPKSNGLPRGGKHGESHIADREEDKRNLELGEVSSNSEYNFM